MSLFQGVRARETCVMDYKFLARVLLPVSVSSLTVLCIGYDMGMMSGAIGPIVHQFHLNDWEQGISVGCFNAVAAVGSLCGSCIIDRWGRVFGVQLTTAFLVVGPLIAATSRHFSVLVVGRLVTGAGGGLALVVAPVYASELAPQDLRGAIVTMVEIMSNIGVMCGYLGAMILNMPGVSKNLGWRLSSGLAALPSVLALFQSISLLESPRWLVKAGRRDEASKVLTFINGDNGKNDAALQAMADAIQEEQNQADWMEILVPPPSVRRMLLCGLGCSVYHQACGSEAFLYNTARMLKAFGLTSVQPRNLATIVVGIVPIIGSILGAWLFDFIGRRGSLLLSSVSTFLSLVGMLIAVQWGIEAPIIGTALFCAFCFSVDMGLGPGVLVLGTESYPVAIRAKALALGLFLNKMLSGVIAFFVPELWDHMGLSALLCIFIFIAATGIIWAWLCVPETAGLSLEDAARMYHTPISTSNVYEEAENECMDTWSNLPLKEKLDVIKPADY